MKFNESIEHLYGLMKLAMNKTYNSDKKENYKWVLGVNVIHKIEDDHAYYVMATYPTQVKTLFGVIVEVDFDNPDNVQLWENITNKL